MRVVIHYCRTCGFKEPADAIAERLHSELGVQAELQSAFWGTFRIERDGQVVYDRWRTRGLLGRIGLGRTPGPDEIVELIRSGDPSGVAGHAAGASPAVRHGETAAESETS